MSADEPIELDQMDECTAAKGGAARPVTPAADVVDLCDSSSESDGDDGTPAVKPVKREGAAASKRAAKPAKRAVKKEKRGGAAASKRAAKPAKRAAKPAKRAVKKEKKRKAAEVDSDEDDDEDDDCAVLEAPAAKRRPAAAAAAAGGASAMDEDEDDVVIEGQSGSIALVDFPHARANCVTQAFVPGNFQMTCANCYCYVCDAPANTCDQWEKHCAATHTDLAWQKERERLRQAKLSQLSTPAPAAGGGAAAAAAAPARALTISCDSLMKQVEQVWPIEESAPAGLNAQLRPYQRQSLAFMLNLERAPAGAKTIGYDRARQTAVRGGWLTDEVGMGKTVVCIATILANPLPAHEQTTWDVTPAKFDTHYMGSWYESYLDDEGKYANRLVTGRMRHRTPVPNKTLMDRYGNDKMKLKTTLILTKNTLIGQWKDEFEKFAPHLNVVVFHGQSSGSQRDAITKGKFDLSKADVLLNTTHTKLPEWLAKIATFHRIIIDESHEMKGSPGQAYPSGLRWAVTGTPCVKAFTDLDRQLYFLGQSSSKISAEVKNLKSLKTSNGGSANAKRAFARLVAELRTLMIRHTKAQRIAGDAALKLPELDSETVWLNMTKNEMLEYQQAKVTDSGSWWKAKVQGTDVWSATMRLRHELAVCSKAGTKLDALVADLVSLRRQEPHLHAVVFTQSVAAHKEICTSISQAGFTVYEIAGSTAVKKRHKAIRDFQASEPRPKVFVLTMKTGSCGITLTAATRVYLMEPCIDPAHELQAAGRIHRLGQSKDVLCKRFVFRSTYEEQVVELHRQLKSGQAALTDGKLSGKLFQLVTKQ